MNNSTTASTITNFISQTFTSTHKSNAVIGLSGGIDSATSLFLTAKALGPSHVHAFYLPTKKSNPIHLIDAKKATAAAGIPEENFHHFPITSIIQKSWRLIKLHSPQISNSNDPTSPQLRLANLTARIRMLILFDAAKKLDALVIGTENLSERMLGYFTRFGDEASDLEPIAHLFKTEVVELAKQLGVPDSIITKAPTADLWPGQTDAAELGFTYEEADPILKLIKKGEKPSGELADKVVAQIKKAAFKQQVPYHL